MCYLGVQNLNHMECFHHILSFSHKVDPRHRSDPAPTINKSNRGNDCVTNGRNLSPWMTAAWRSAPRQPESLTHLRARERNRYAVSPSQGATAQLSLQLTHLPTRKTFIPQYPEEKHPRRTRCRTRKSLVANRSQPNSLAMYRRTLGFRQK